MKPYYEHGGVTIFNGDARDILPTINAVSLITDPVWPQPSKLLTGADRPYELFRETCRKIPNKIERIVVHLGCISDVRFMACVPKRYPFFRVCWLSQIPCSFRGRVLNSGDVAYAFGVPPKGTGIIPGECMSNEHPIYKRSLHKNRSIAQFNKRSAELSHPAVRKLRHVRWLVQHFGGGHVVDPFGGSGTTAVACKSYGWPCTLIEIEERFCELAAKRLSQDNFDWEDPA